MDTRTANNLNGFVAVQWFWSVEPSEDYFIVGDNDNQSVTIQLAPLAENRIYRLYCRAEDSNGCVIEKEKDFLYEE